MATPGRTSVIVCIYNAIGVARQALAALAEHSETESTEIILVDNHSPDAAIREYLIHWERAHRNCRIIDPGRNVGCHGGWNIGMAHAHGDMLVKLDDDTEIRQDDWIPKMREALEKVPTLAYISADIDAKQNNPVEMQTHNGVQLEVALRGIVGFSCVMFRRSDIDAWGPMKVGAYRAAGGRVLQNVERLYGGEEVYYADIARQNGKILAHLPSVFVHHLGNAERHPDYAAWKRAYGFHGWCDKGMEQWIADGDHVLAYMKFLALELQRDVPNDVLLMEWCKRLSEIGPKYCGSLLLQAYEKTTNGVAKESIAWSMRKMHDRLEVEK